MKIILIGLIACAAWGQTSTLEQNAFPHDALTVPSGSIHIFTDVEILEMLDRQRMDLAAMEQLQYQGFRLLPNLVAPRHRCKPCVGDGPCFAMCISEDVWN